MVTTCITVVIVAIVVTLHRSEAAEYAVGNAMGWTQPSVKFGPDPYAFWASNFKFFVEDVLVFRFEKGKDDLAFVTPEDFNNCKTAKPIIVWTETCYISFHDAGTYHFTSTFPGHCSGGQKLAVFIDQRPKTSPTLNSSTSYVKTSSPARTCEWKNGYKKMCIYVLSQNRECF